MMRPTRLLPAVLLAAALSAPSLASAQTSQISRGRNFGLGLVFGFPNVGAGINAFLSQVTSIQADVSFPYNLAYGYFSARVDLLFWMSRLASASWGDVRWYLGPGANLGVVNGAYRRPFGDRYDSGTFFELEVPVGIGFQFKVPVDLMLEAIPRLYLVDSNIGFYPNVEIAAALHARYYF